MAAVKLTISERTKVLQASAATLAGHLERLRTALDNVRIHDDAHRRVTQEGKVQSRLALAERELALAKCESQKSQVDHLIDDFTVMWQELCAELDLAHVLAVTPE